VRKSINQNECRRSTTNKEKYSQRRWQAGSRVTSAGSVLAFHYRNRSGVKSMRHPTLTGLPWCCMGASI